MKYSIILTLSLLFCAQLLLGQMHNHLLRDGEGLQNKSDVAVMWINPGSLQPAIFFDKREVAPRTNPKWWRNDLVAPVLLAPQTTTTSFQEELKADGNDLVWRWELALSTSTWTPTSFGEDIPEFVPLWKNLEIEK